MPNRSQLIRQSPAVILFIAVAVPAIVWAQMQYLQGPRSGAFEAANLKPPCGPWAVKRCCDLLGVPASITKVNGLFRQSTTGHTLLELKNSLAQLGIQADGHKIRIADLSHETLPCLLYLTSPRHFVVVSSITDGLANIFDCSGRRGGIPLDTLSHRWDGVLLRLSRPSDINVAHGNRPEACFDTLCVDFGVVRPSTYEVTKAFQVSNTGTADLVIRRLQSTCECITASADDVTISPGGVQRVDVSFHPTGQHGAFVRDLLIETNDVYNEKVLVTATGIEDAGAYATPTVAEFGTICTGESVSRQVLVFRSTAREDSHIISAECDLNNVDVRVLRGAETLSAPPRREKVDVPESFGRVVARGVPTGVVEVEMVPSEVSLGNLRGELKIKVGPSAEQAEEVKILVTANVISALRLFPPVLAVSYQKKTNGDQTDGRAILSVGYRDGGAFRIESAYLKNVLGSIDFPRQEVSGLADISVRIDQRVLSEAENPSVFVAIRGADSSRLLTATVPVHIIE